MHYCSSPKPWEDAQRRGGPLEALWWQFHRELVSVSAAATSASASVADAVTAAAPSAAAAGDEEEELPLTCSPTSDTSGAWQSAGRWPTFEVSMAVRPVQRFGLWSPVDAAWLDALRGEYARAAAMAPEGAGVPRVIHQVCALRVARMR